MTRIVGRYEITAKLGEGGMGVVFRAHDPAPMDREVAVKTLHEFADPLALELFYKECAALKSISHPNIVEIFDMGEYEQDGERRPFFVMPLLPGESLDRLIRSASHRLTVDRVVQIFGQACRGLQAAHEQGLVHRDLKPSNIFVMPDDSVKLIDFGVAHAVYARSRTTGADKGTLLYMAPEQVQHKPASVQSDIYALGVTLYEALTRRQPFRSATEDAVIQAILTQIPPAASDLNPSVSQLISRVVHKAMAKQPWNRFDTARELGETLQKAYHNEPIALFDPSRTQPRIQTATRALEKGDYQFAGEIVAELEAEGNIDPQITLLRAQIDQTTRQKTVAQLLESARARYEEGEDPLALQKLQEILQFDPTNVGALGLKSKIDDRRSEQQIEKWIRLARQHIDNHSYSHAREALQSALTLRPKDARAVRLLKEIESEEHEYVRLRREKTDLYQSAVNAWKNGEVSQALSQMKAVLDLDRRAPDASAPDGVGAYQSFYDKLRSEHDAINNGYAEARRHVAERAFTPALRICQEFLAKYPGHALFQALKFDIDEQQRQQLSAFIADVNRRVEVELDLGAKVHVVREALAEYPDEDHFVRLARHLEDKRDLVNSIIERSRVHESAGQITEAISDLDTLQTIYAVYPGLTFERERLQKRLEQQARDMARATWVRQIDGQLQAGNYVRAVELLDRAEAEHPGDGELAELRKLAVQERDRASRADQLIAEGQTLCAQGQFEQGVDLLQIALQLDDRTGVRLALRDLLVARAQESRDADWRIVENLAGRALELDPNHALARSLRAQALDQKRDEDVSQHASQARRLQAAGDLDAAMAEVDTGLAAYPGDARLTVIADALKKESRPSTRASAPTVVAPRVAAEEPTRIIDRRSLSAQQDVRAPAPLPKPQIRATRLRVLWVAIAAGVVLVAVVVGGVTLWKRPSPAPQPSTAAGVPTPAPDSPVPVPEPAPTTPVPTAVPTPVPARPAQAHDSPKVTRDVTSGRPLRGSPADVKPEHLRARLNVKADPDTEITITQDGHTVRQLKEGTTSLELDEGRYDLVAKGRAGYETKRAVTLTAGTPVTIDIGSFVATGMELFGAGWVEGKDNDKGWFTRRGGDFVLYDRPGSQATISFTIRMDGKGNPFSSGDRFSWVVGYVDSRNYIQLQLDEKNFYRTVVSDGKQTQTKIGHQIKSNKVGYIYLSVHVEGNQLVHKYNYSTQPGDWQTLDSWPAARLLDGRFAFYLRDAGEISIANFRYEPSVK